MGTEAKTLVGGHASEAERLVRGDQNHTCLGCGQPYGGVALYCLECWERGIDLISYTGTNGFHPQFDNDHDAMCFAIGYLRALRNLDDHGNWRALVGDLLEKIDDGRGLS